MHKAQMGLLTEAIYDAALDPKGWAHVIDALTDELSTHGGGLYFLDYGGRSMRTLHVRGIDAQYRDSFDRHFFTSDNPWTRAAPLHRPGVVRTDERLVKYFGDRQILRRSQYYNEWLRPQEFQHSLGSTLLAEGGIIANLTLLRSGEIGGFKQDEVVAFERICRHFRRSLRMAMRLETLAGRASASLEVLDHLPTGVALVDAKGRLKFCNMIAEAMIRAGDGLTVRDGTLAASAVADRSKLSDMLQCLARVSAVGDIKGRCSAIVHGAGDGHPITINGARLSAAPRTFAAAEPTFLLLVDDPMVARRAQFDAVRSRYRLTRSETRLARGILSGASLKQIAEESGISYETARWYLKVLFQKTGTNRQAELVARLLIDTLPLSPGRKH